MNYINRALEADIRTSLKRNPATAILGPRQCGKSTLARKILDEIKPSVYLDLERPSDIQKLQDPEWFLGSQSDKLICLDEIQRYPELFPVLRSLIDAEGRNGMYIILGSASRDMLKQSSETLAGRISFKQLTPFIWEEVNASKTLEDYLSRGGFPRSLLAENDEASYEWRRDFIMTFLERDLLQFAGFTPATMRRLWQMLAHSNGQTVNYSSLGNSLGVSHTTIRNYIDLLEGAFMVRQVLPYFENTKKRIVKSPKVYITDTGLINALLGLKDFIQVAGHPGFGSLWETTVLVNLIGKFPDLDLSFYRNSQQQEIDFVLHLPNSRIAVECKATKSPRLSDGNYAALKDIEPDVLYIVCPVEEGYPLKPGIEVVSLQELIEKIK
jgi:predicted AAA+ superfamily ATPase